VVAAFSCIGLVLALLDPFFYCHGTLTSSFSYSTTNNRYISPLHYKLFLAGKVASIPQKHFLKTYEGMEAELQHSYIPHEMGAIGQLHASSASYSNTNVKLFNVKQDV
jgi:hypothetical protein